MSVWKTFGPVLRARKYRSDRIAICVPPKTTQERGQHWRVLLLMIAVALAVRLVCVMMFFSEQLTPDQDRFAFGWEVGRVARSLAEGRGFASPLLGDTGPTAWLPPVYPGLLAGVFRLFGIYTVSAAIAILSLNSLFSALTVLPVFVLARQTFSVRTARWAGWSWTFFPFGIYIPVFRIWGESLDALLTTLVLLSALRMATKSNLLLWLSSGMIAGFAALTNPNTMSILPGLWGWACYRLQQSGTKWKKPLSVAVIGLLIMVGPWFVRNYTVFGKVLPFRSNFWLEVSIGNNANTPVMLVDWNAHPASNALEWAEYQRLGELPYMALKRQQAIGFIRKDPAMFFLLTVRRIVFVWTGFWSFDPGYLSSEPLQVPLILFNLGFSTLMAVGGFMVWRARRPVLFPFLVLAVCQPAVYYLTHPAIEYRHAIDPVMVLLGAIGLRHAVDRVRQPRYWFGARTSEASGTESV